MLEIVPLNRIVIRRVGNGWVVDQYNGDDGETPKNLLNTWAFGIDEAEHIVDVVKYLVNDQHYQPRKYVPIEDRHGNFTIE
jgi:hypothetical protein